VGVIIRVWKGRMLYAMAGLGDVAFGSQRLTRRCPHDFRLTPEAIKPLAAMIRDRAVLWPQKGNTRAPLWTLETRA